MRVSTNKLLLRRIVGRWDDYPVAGYGSMEAWVIAFRADGTGWCSFERHIRCEVVRFKWRIEGSMLCIRRKGAANPLRYSVSFKRVKTPAGETVSAVIFKPALWMGSGMFALVSRRAEKLRLPQG